MYRFLILFNLLLVPLCLIGNTQKSFFMNFVIPKESSKLGQSQEIFFTIDDPASPWQVGAAQFQVIAFTSVAPYSKGKNVQVNSKFKFTFESAQKGIKIPMQVLQDGEYELQVIVELNPNQLWRRRNLGILAEGGRVWFGLDSIADAVENKLKEKLGFNKLTHPLSPEEENKLRIGLEKEWDLRRKKVQSNSSGKI